MTFNRDAIDAVISNDLLIAGLSTYVPPSELLHFVQMEGTALLLYCLPQLEHLVWPVFLPANNGLKLILKVSK